jgi:hypothetical protein
MDAKKGRIVAGAALVGAGVLASRSFRAKLHQRCESACAGNCGGADDDEEPAEPKCSPPATRHAA